MKLEIAHKEVTFSLVLDPVINQKLKTADQEVDCLITGQILHIYYIYRYRCIPEEKIYQKYHYQKSFFFPVHTFSLISRGYFLKVLYKGQIIIRSFHW